MNRTAGAASQGQAADSGGADAPLTDSSRLFWTICGDGGYTTQSHVLGKRFGTICPKVEKGKATLVVLLGGVRVKDKVVVEILIADYPNTLLVLILWNPIITLRPNNDNPNYIIQVGDVFGFIISIENII